MEEGNGSGDDEKKTASLGGWIVLRPRVSRERPREMRVFHQTHTSLDIAEMRNQLEAVDGGAREGRQGKTRRTH